jgi:uncharacterized protein
MMRIHIEQITEKGLFLDFAERAENFPVLAQMIQDGECEFLGPIRTRLRAVKIRDFVEVEGTVETQVKLTCGRCLEVFTTVATNEFALTYNRRAPEATAESEPKDVELKADDFGLIQFQGETIDLQEGIQEQVVMAFPIRPLCAQDCRGLCQSCGANLNLGDCGCDRAIVDDRFAVLKNLRFEKK